MLAIFSLHNRVVLLTLRSADDVKFNLLPKKRRRWRRMDDDSMCECSPRHTEVKDEKPKLHHRLPAAAESDKKKTSFIFNIFREDTKIAWKVFHLMMFQFTLPISYYVTTTTSHFLLIYYYCLLIILANNFLCRDLQDFLNLRLVWLRFNNKIIIMFSYFQSIYFFFVSFIFRLLVSLRNSPSDPSRLIQERKEKLDQ